MQQELSGRPKRVIYRSARFQPYGITASRTKTALWGLTSLNQPTKSRGSDFGDSIFFTISGFFNQLQLLFHKKNVWGDFSEAINQLASAVSLMKSSTECLKSHHLPPTKQSASFSIPPWFHPGDVLHCPHADRPG